jgi:ABC-type transporter Mla maintaining outer membrane lipid asymmetry ATPase subunit MlaF
MPAPTLPSENPAASVASLSGYAIEFDKVSIAFDENVVLDGISFQLPHG